METTVVDETLQHVRDLLEVNDVAGAIRLIETLRPADQAEIFDELPEDQQGELFTQLETEDAADILEKLDDEGAAELAARIDADVLAQIVDEMETDEAADLLGDLDPSLSTATLSQLSEPDEIRPLLLHPDETAGGLMTSEYLAFPQSMTVQRVIAALRQWSPKGSETPYLFVVDRDDRIVGVATPLQVIRAEPTQTLASIMDPEVVTVRADADQETTARLMARYDLGAVPVVDEEGRLVGIITSDDLVDVLEGAATEDIQRIAATEPLDRPYLDTSVTRAAWKRLGWLLLLFVTGTLTGTVMRLFENQLDQVITLAVFIPLLIGTGGNAGAQTTATIIRALSVGEIDLGDFVRVLWHEMRTALLLAVLLSLVAFARALFWEDSLEIALVVSGSIFAIVVWANTVGALLPLLAEKLHIDPALVSGPLMSTLVDATGLLIYFSIARLILAI
jgi:magnesium transporter